MRAYAKIYHYYRTFTGRLLRVALVVFLEWWILTQISQGIFPNITFFVLLFYSMWEIFFRFHIATYHPKISVWENDGKDILVSSTLKTLEIVCVYHSSESIIRTLLHKEQIHFMLIKADIAPKDILFLAMSSSELLQEAFLLSKKTNAPFITTMDVFTAYLLKTEAQTKVLFNHRLSEKALFDILFWTKAKYKEDTQTLQACTLWGRGIAEVWVSGWMVETKRYTIDFTKKIVQNPAQLAGRKKELDQLVQALRKSRKQNAMLIGQPGVGKTSIVKAFAEQSFLGTFPLELSYKRVYELSIASLVAGAESQGALEQRVKGILEELTHAGDAILYIPEIQNIVGSGGFGLDASGALLPALLGDAIQVIGTVTPENYKKYIEKKSEFVFAFDPIEVREPTKEEAILMLEEASIPVENKHQTNITYGAIAKVVELSEKYAPDRFLPGKAIDLLDEAAASAVSLKKESIVQDDIVVLIEAKSNIPIATPKKEEQTLLLHLEDELHKRVIDQNEAVQAVAQALRRLRVGISFEHRPVGVFLFLGPTGVGKTELAKALSAIYYKSDERIVRLDMGAYKDATSIYRLIGAPPGLGEERGELTEKVWENPFSLVLLDEFEKAHSSVLDAFLSIFEDGRLTDAKGRVVSFANTIIIATSNAGAEVIREAMAKGTNLQSLKPYFVDLLLKQSIFKPELLNRFDAVVLFEPLGSAEVQQVTALLLAKVQKKLLEQEIHIVFDARVVEKIAKEGYDKQFGARPIMRYIQDHIEEMLSQKMLKEEVKRGSNVVFSTDNAGNITASVT